MSPVAQSGHAFVSYVREDADAVAALAEHLSAAGIAVWRDTENLWPGDDWRQKIREAIEDHSLVFIACFSTNSMARTKPRSTDLLAMGT